MTLKRARHKMPEFIKKAITDNNLTQEYKERPDYQQNDYIGWITQAKLDETKIKRLNQMIDELKKGTLYMKMKYHKKKQ